MISKILIDSDFISYLEKRNLGNQYKKAQKYLLDSSFKQVDFRIREPKKNKIFYFKINNKYRAWWKLKWSILKIIEIDDHQD